MLQCQMFILNIAKMSNNEVNIRKSNPCEQKAPAFRLPSIIFFYFQTELMSEHDRFLYIRVGKMYLRRRLHFNNGILDAVSNLKSSKDVAKI